MWFAEFMERRRQGQPSPHTLRALRQDFDAIAELLAAGTSIEHIDIRHVTKPALSAAFATYADNHSKTSNQRCRSTWNTLCTWLIDEDYLDGKNPMRQFPKSKPDRPLPYALTDDDLTALVDAAWAADNPPRSWPQLEHALIAMGALTGVREAELASLNVDDIRLTSQGPVLNVQGKGGKGRAIGFEPELLTLIEDYLTSRISLFPHHITGAGRRARKPLKRLPPDAPLFVGANGDRITVATIRSRMLRLFKRSGVTRPKGALFHALRHTYATALADLGISTYDLQRLLGHETLDATQRYIAAAGHHGRTVAAQNPNYRIITRRPR